MDFQMTSTEIDAEAAREQGWDFPDPAYEARTAEQDSLTIQTDDLVFATMQTAFGKTARVQVIERDGDRADIALSTGQRAVVKWTSLDFDPDGIAADIEREASLDLPVTETGVYLHGGEVYKVQRSKTSGGLYAKRLVVIGGKRLVETGEKVNFEYEYAPGVVRNMTAAERMTLEQAKAFGIEYGVCAVCGAFLKDADSVAAGIGPVCAKRL